MAVATSTYRLAPWHGAREAVRAAFWLGLREARMSLRTPAALVPNLIMPLAFFFVLTGSLSSLASDAVGNFRGFQLPVALMFAVTGGSAGLNMVADVESGYFDKLLLTPASRLALLVGAMSADFLRILAQGAFTATVALATGMEFATGVGGVAVMIVIAALWGLMYSGLGFAVALKTGNAQATQSTWLLFFPLMFLTTIFAPEGALSGWLGTAAQFNPITYFLRGLRSLALTGWDAGEIGLALLVVVGTGAVTLPIALRALIGRTRG
jgi:ABC-2 type transport system permease protein